MQSLINQASQSVINFEERNKTFVGYLWSLLSACCLATSSYFVKKVPDHIPSTEILLYRSIQLSIYAYLFMKTQNHQFHYRGSSLNRLLLARTLTGAIAIILTYWGLKLLPLSDSIVIMQTFPVPTGFFAWIILGEKYESIQFWTAITCLLGVGLIAQPAVIFGESSANVADGGDRMLGTIVLALSSIFTGLTQVLVRQTGNKTNVGLVTIYFSHGSIILSAVVCLYQGISPVDWYSAVQMFWVALPIFGAQIFRNRAFMLVKAGRVAVMGYFGILYGYFLDIFLLGTQVSLLSVLGAVCIFSCMFFYIYQMYQKEKEGK